MPRKKVAPQDRVRAARACQQCRQSKKKCNGDQPCTNCVRKGSAPQCTFNDVIPARSDRRHSTTRPSTSSEAISIGNGDTFFDDTASNSQSQSHGHVGSPEVSVRTFPRMLSNARGERVFVGEHASLSFLQFMRDIIRASIGISDFSVGPRQDLMLEADLEDDLEMDQSLLSDENVQAWTEGYLIATNGLIDLFSRQEVENIVQNSRRSDLSDRPLTTAISYLILAIGAQVSNDAHYTRKEHVLFAVGIKAAFAGYLQEPGLMTIQAFVLAACYMFGACRRNAAYMYLGIAMRSAHAIGLHTTTSYQSLSSSDSSKRSRIWHSLFALDIMACSILGRPSGNTAMSSQAEQAYNPSLEDTQPRLAVYSAYNLAKIVEDISNNFNGRKTLQIEQAEQQLEAIQEWSRALPHVLRIQTPLEAYSIDACSRIVGSLQISCFHHFSVLLVTRPFLIPVLLKRIAPQQQDEAASSESLSAADEARAARLAHTCVNVAIYMIDTCWQVYDRGIMPGNVCILQAWLFAAALVIGFHLFTSNAGVDGEAEHAYFQSQRILQYLSIRSPQSKHYHDILNHLHDAIRKRHQQKATPSRKQNSFAIDRLLTSGSDQLVSLNDENGITNVASSMGNGNDLVSNGTTEEWLNYFPTSDMELQQFLQGSDMGGSTTMFPYWDQFSFEL